MYASMQLIKLATRHNFVRNRSLLGRFWSSTNKADNTSSSWEDRVSSRIDLLNPWSTRDLTPLPKAYMALDKQTRYLVQLLQELQSYPSTTSSENNKIDRATTKRCNRILENISINSAKKPIPGQSDRSYAILRGMEALERIPSNIALMPYPTPETYRLVLRSFATDPKGNPFNAEAIVRRMKKRIDPTIIHWNDVLSAWAVNATADSKEDNKAYHAANLLQKLKEKHIVDSSSYSHTLRACLSSALPSSSRRAQKLGTEIGRKVFADYKAQISSNNTTLEAKSIPYSLYLQICRQMPDIELRHALALSAFDDCWDRGLINNYILDSLSKALSPEGYKERMRRYWDKSMSNKNKPEQIFQRLPTSATRNAILKKQKNIGW